MQNPYLYTGEARSAQRGGFLGMLADLLGGAKSWMNAPGTLPAGVPLVGGQGLGDLVMGQAPEYLDDRSYGLGGARNGGADPRLMDLAMLLAPGAGRAAGVARALPGVARQAAFDAYGPTVHMAQPRMKHAIRGQLVTDDEMMRHLGIGPYADSQGVVAPEVVKEAKRIRKEVKETPGAPPGARPGMYAIGGVQMTAEELAERMGLVLPPPKTLAERKADLLERQRRLGW